MLMRNIGIGILVVVVIAGAYIFLVGDNSSTTALLTKDASSGSAPATTPQIGVSLGDSQELREITLVLNQLKSISIDDGALFESPAFRSLTDFHLEIPPQPQGRVNPFLPGEGIKTAQPGR